ncbi:hypothetical protein [uncultured Oscillibacter sp.]|uniref:hypothetical protein n=1 Tax=uncultured Oscillibacter sp. TaxID=876091 RepID=UPI0025EB422A|nr:hypothetical protein [uncultured Oscillibacter sp.]
MRKMDEMELHIQLRALRWAWLADVLVLAVWGIWGSIRTGRMTAPMYLLIFQNLIYFFAVQAGKIRVGDQDGRRSLVLCAVMAAALVVLSALLAWCLGT